MKKLSLSVESLVVESFDTMVQPMPGRGTVRGRDSETEPQEPDTIASTCTCPQNTLASCGAASCGAASCQWSCDPGCTAVTCGEATCNQTCPDTCYVCGPQGPH